jgi:hypothetical protein
LPAKFIDSDASFNIGMTIATLQTCINGIFLVINGGVSRIDNGYGNMATILPHRDAQTGMFLPSSSSIHIPNSPSSSVIKSRL